VTGKAPHSPSNAARAAATAASTSGLPASYTVPTGELSIGVRFSNVFPLAFLMYSPSTKFRMSVLTMGFPPVLGCLTLGFLTPGMMTAALLTTALLTTALPRIAPHVRRA